MSHFYCYSGNCVLNFYQFWFSGYAWGEFNSGKSSVINDFLGKRYLKDGVVPTTNELTFLRYSESDSGEEQCERHPDGQLMCYLLAPVLKDFVGIVGGLVVAGPSASLLTSVLSTTLEDLLALGLCSAGGLLAISNFPASRQRVIDKVKRTATALARQIDEAMQNDLLETVNSLNNFVTLVGKPYQEVAEHRVSKLSDTQDELSGC